MPRLDNQKEFQAAAAEDGVILGKQSFPWLCWQGHWALPEGDTRELLARIWIALKGEPEGYAERAPTRLTGDFFHEATGSLIEYDEKQHFTTARLVTLREYPADQSLGFEHDGYIALCKRCKVDADKYRATKEAVGFPGANGRQRQRAYYDALRDLATPAFGHPPLIRVADIIGNGKATWARERDRLIPVLER